MFLISIMSRSPQTSTFPVIEAQDGLGFFFETRERDGGRVPPGPPRRVVRCWGVKVPGFVRAIGTACGHGSLRGASESRALGRPFVRWFGIFAESDRDAQVRVDNALGNARRDALEAGARWRLVGGQTPITTRQRRERKGCGCRNP